MLRDELISNLNKLDGFERYILEYVTKKSFDWFCNTDNSVKAIRDCLYCGFAKYFEHTIQDGIKHPFYKVWEKIKYNVNMDPLFIDVEAYGDTYNTLAEEINELYMGKYRNTIHIILKAFAERDFDEWDSLTNDIESYAYDIASNLDENDLRTILCFCGKNIDLE